MRERDDLAGHPDRQRWNARYAGREPSFEPHALAVAAAELAPPLGAVLELACGPSGSALAAAAAGRYVTAVDVSDVALRLLRDEAERRGLLGLIDIVHADLEAWRPAGAPYALVLCAGYWDRQVFGRAAAAVADGGVLAWQALTATAAAARPGLPAAWCLRPGEPAVLLPAGFTVVAQADLPAPGPAGTWRRLLARRG
ncbi:MAG TPA: class I SAM-dependent methyltransferase [Streptosporangiaceae bacterium]|jgi:SAM-dependent methyltransferase